MKNISRIVLLLVFLVLIGGGSFLAMWDMPPPSKTITKRIPDARFSK